MNARGLYHAAAVLVALAMFAAALGSGNPDAAPDAARLPAWVDTLGNVLAAGFGVLVLIPRTRAGGALAAAALMALAMGVNYTVDGVDFFLRALPFNLITIALSAFIVWRSRG